MYCLYILPRQLAVYIAVASIATKLFALAVTHVLAYGEAGKNLKAVSIELLVTAAFSTLTAVAITALAGFTATPAMVLYLASMIALPSTFELFIKSSVNFHFTERSRKENL